MTGSKEELIREAARLGHDYLAKYKGCVQTTLLAVAETLDTEIDDELFKAMIGLSGKTGGCGGLCGATAAIGLRLGLGPSEFEKEPEIRFKVYHVTKEVREKFVAEHGSYLCSDIQTRLFGRVFDSTIPEDQAAFEKAGGLEKCSKVTEKAAMWAMEAILGAESCQ